MRLSPEQRRIITELVRQTAGQQARVRLFGSRLDDNARGGDIDLLIELDTAIETPAALAATLSARIDRALGGRKVDILIAAPNLQRIHFLVSVVQKVVRHLTQTDDRLFAQSFTTSRAAELTQNIELAERVDAFVSRFGRLQDTLGDKLRPTLLAALGERPGVMIDNLNHAERLGWISDADAWLRHRNLRNQMVHEYISDTLILSNALQTGHEAVPSLIAAAHAMTTEAEYRGWA
jgi:predicted nucleotidyltransferase